MKIFFSLICICICLQSRPQASSSSWFQLTVAFDRHVSVMNILPAYYEQNGNHFSEIHFKRNVSENTITVFGYNHFILWVTFPTLMFFEYDNYGQTQLLRQTYYFVSLGSVSTYPQEKAYVFGMKKRRPYLINNDIRWENMNYVLKTKTKRKMPPFKDTTSALHPIEEAH